MNVTVGEKMKIIVNRSGYTLADIHKATGLSVDTVRKIFVNKASLGSWMVLCKFLNVELDVNIIILNCKE